MAERNVSLQDRIKEIKPYFKGIEIKENLFIVKINFPQGWNAYDREDGIIKAAKSDVAENEWFYYANVDEVDLNDIFDLIQDTIKNNEEIYQKIELMKIKMGELKELFQNESLEKLQTIKFVFETVKPKRVSKRKKKALEMVEEVNAILQEDNNNSDNEIKE